MSTYPVEIQDDETACGVYCLKMILQYYGVEEDAAIIKEKCRMDERGTSIKGLVEALSSYTIEAKAYHCPLTSLSKVKLPCILHFQKNGYGHFVVLYEMKENDYLIGDPQCGLRHMKERELEAIYSENLIAITHLGRYYHYQNQSFHRFLKSQHKRYRHELHGLNRISFTFSLISLLSAVLYAILIDRLQVNSSYLLIALILGAYGLMSFLKVLLALLQEKKMNKLHRCFDEDYVASSLAHVMNYDESFFARGEERIASQLFEFYSLSDFSLDYFSVIDHDAIIFVVLLIGLSLISLAMTCVLIALLAIMVVIVKYQSENIVLLHKQMKKAEASHCESLMSVIHGRNNRYLFNPHYLDRYNKAFLAASDGVNAYEKQSCSIHRTILLLETFLNIILLSIGLYFYREVHLTMGEVLMFMMLTFQLLSQVVTIIKIGIMYQEEKIVFEKYKECHLPVAYLHDQIEEIQQITVHNLSYSYGYHEDVLSHLDFTIDHSCFLEGDNGSGKSTLLRLLAGADHYYRGEICYNEVELKDLSTKAIASHVIYIGESQLFAGSVLDNLICEDMGQIATVLKNMGALELSAYFDTHIDETGAPLSRGQAAYILVARALLSNAKICLLDETLDALSIERACKLLDVLMKSDKIFVIVTHHEALKVGYDHIDLSVQKDHSLCYNLDES